EEILAKTRFVFAGDRLTVLQGDKDVDETTIKLDPKKKPAAIDIVPGKGPNKGKVSEGIYAFEGDTLKICTAAPGQKRPTEFKSDRGSRAGLLILKRAKPGAARRAWNDPRPRRVQVSSPPGRPAGPEGGASMHALSAAFALVAALATHADAEVARR